MKTLTLALAAAGALTVTSASGDPPPWARQAPPPTHTEIVLTAQGLGPRETANWTGGTGFEAQLRLWKNPEYGVALAAGMQTWEAARDYAESDDGYSAVATSIGGNARLTPIGISLLYRGDVASGLQVLLEGGMRYAFADSEVLLDAAYVDDHGSEYLSDTIEVENTFLAVLAIDLEWQLAPDLAVVGGLGYQLDLLKPNETTLGADLGSTSFSAMTARLGVLLEF